MEAKDFIYKLQKIFVSFPDNDNTSILHVPWEWLNCNFNFITASFFTNIIERFFATLRNTIVSSEDAKIQIDLAFTRKDKRVLALRKCL